MRFYLIIIPLVLLLGLVLSASGGTARLQRVTYDDATALRTTKTQRAKESHVLGVSSDNPDFLCPKENPIIGWIDYFGNKVIVDSLSYPEEPSACFKDIEQANENEFFRVQD